MDRYDSYIARIAISLVTVGLSTIIIKKAIKTFCSSPAKLPMDFKMQTVEIPNSDGTRQSKLAAAGEPFGFDDVKTFCDVLQKGKHFSGDGPCLGWRGEKPEYFWLSYSEVIEKANNFGAGLVHIGMQPGQSTVLGVYAKNRPEWVISEQACYSQSAVVVPIYDTYGTPACSFIINQAEIQIIVCDTEDKVKGLIEQKNQIPVLKQIIYIEGVSDEVRKQAQEGCISLHSFEEVEKLGKLMPIGVQPPSSDDLAIICYTSGTNGEPKGVMLTHSNIVTCIVSGISHMASENLDESDTMISFLPLAHSYERIAQGMMFISGSKIGFYRGDIKLLTEDMKVLKPTVFFVVPRVLNKIYDKVQAQLKDSSFKRFVFNLALRKKQSEIKRFIIRNNSVMDYLVFKKLRESLGGNLRIVVSGSAPLAGEVLTFFRCALGCLVQEGYGLTEAAGPVTCSIPRDYGAEHVGVPLPCFQIKLVDVPDMEYYAKNNQGEVCVKGSPVFRGYYKDPVKTAETIDSDGWLHTGDVGVWLPNGVLKIIDRKKNIFKLSQGEYIATEKLETVFLGSRYVSQIYIHGESMQSYVVAIVVPDEEFVMCWSKGENIFGSFVEICKNEKLKSIILEDMKRIGKNACLKSFELVKDIYISPFTFTMESEFLTPTMKNKRNTLSKYFANEINLMYKKFG